MLDIHRSVAMFTFRTPCLNPSTISSTGTPYVSPICPPNSSVTLSHSCGTDDEPCIRR